MSKVRGSTGSNRHERAAKEEWRREKKIKCLVWDLDNTIWDGILLEDADVSLRANVMEVLETLDERGILHSIASRNNHQLAMSKLEHFGIHEYFVYPQINWGAKSGSIEQIARLINIGMDTIALVDDQAFERDEVISVHPDVQCFDAVDLACIPDHPEMMPRFISSESRQRRKMLQVEIVRREAEESFEGAQDKFLESLDMKLEIYPAGESDLKRAEELTLRTNQLNTTGRTFSYDELNKLRLSENFHLWVARLEDKYGSHGTIGLSLIEKLDGEWWIRLLLMSCRVMNRGVGGAMITHIRNCARAAGVRLFADMSINDRNRMMYMTYKFNHFRDVESEGDMTVLENDLDQVQPFPNYLRICTSTE